MVEGGKMKYLGRFLFISQHGQTHTNPLVLVSKVSYSRPETDVGKAGEVLFLAYGLPAEVQITLAKTIPYRD